MESSLILNKREDRIELEFEVKSSALNSVIEILKETYKIMLIMQCAIDGDNPAYKDLRESISKNLDALEKILGSVTNRTEYEDCLRSGV